MKIEIESNNSVPVYLLFTRQHSCTLVFPFLCSSLHTNALLALDRHALKPYAVRP